MEIEMLKKRFDNEETIQDKKYLVSEIAKALKEMERELEAEQ